MANLRRRICGVGAAGIYGIFLKNKRDGTGLRRGLRSVGGWGADGRWLGDRWKRAGLCDAASKIPAVSGTCVCLSFACGRLWFRRAGGVSRICVVWSRRLGAGRMGAACRGEKPWR